MVPSGRKLIIPLRAAYTTNLALIVNFSIDDPSLVLGGGDFSLGVDDCIPIIPGDSPSFDDRVYILTVAAVESC